MARENEMRKFTRSFFRGRPDLSTLTHSIVRRRFLSHTGRDHLDPEEKQTLKRLVEKELLKMQMGEAGARQEGLDLVKRAKRPATPCSDSERKRFRLNSESECSDAASSPDYFSAPAKNGTVAAVSPAEERRKRASREAAESSDEGEQWRDLTAQTGLEEEAVKGSCEEEEEEEGSAISKIWKERSSEEEEAVEKKSKGRTRTKPVTRDKTQWKGGERQSGSGKGGGEDSRRKMKTATKGTGESAEVESIKTADSEAGDSEREVSDSEAGGTPMGERKNHSRRKSSNTSRTRSSSSSSASGSPAPKDRKVRGKMGWGTTIKNKRGPVKISASRKQATKDSEDQEEPAQRVGSKGAKSHQESEKESEGEETLAKKEQNREEEDWKPRAPSNGGKTSTWEERSEQKKGRAVRVRGDCWDREEEGKAAGSGDTSGEDEEPLVQRTSEDRTQWKGGTRQSGSGKEGGEDSGRKMKPATKGTGESAEVESGKTANSEASDSEREGTDSEAGGTPTGERKKCSRRKSSKTRTRSSSSSSASGSPDPKDRKAGHRRHHHHHHRGEDHPAVSRLKRYIWACGARRNYKKLLGSCRSHKERLCVLRAELEALGMKGNPSLEKCRALKEQREEAAEVASLDVTNIISCSGRPRRCTAWNPSEVAPPGELYRRTLDSEEECHHPPRPDWSHMRGIISSDGESN